MAGRGRPRPNIWQVPRIAPVSTVLEHEDEQVVGSASRPRARSASAALASLATRVPLVRRQVGEAAAGQLGHFVERVEIVARAPARTRKLTRPLRGEAQDGERRQARALGQAVDDQIFLHRCGSRRRARPSCRPPARRRRRYCCRRTRRRCRASRSPGRDRRRQLADQIEQCLGLAGSIGLGGRPKPPWTWMWTSCAAATIARPHLVDQRLGDAPGRRASPGRKLTRSTAWSGTTLLGAAAVDPGGIDRQAGRPSPAASRSASSAAATQGVAAVLGVAAGMGAAALDDEAEIAAAGPRARQRAVGQRRGLVGQRRSLAPRGRGRSAPPSPASRPPRRC